MKSTLIHLTLVSFICGLAGCSVEPTDKQTPTVKVDVGESKAPDASATPPAIDSSVASTSSERNTDSSVLGIGSTAPALDIEHWVSDGHAKFTPVSEFESGRVYVVEFWATWCGPCVSSMPHLVEVQERFGEDVQIISVSRESTDKVTSFLKRPYTGGGEDGPKTYGELTSAYCLTVDPDGSVNDDYMRAAGQTGIPCSFIVGKSGLVEWIGHPMSMDKPLSDVVNDTWDRDAFTTAFRDRQAAKLLSRNFTGQLRAGDFDKAAATLSECAEKLPAMSINNLTWNVYEYSNRKEIPDSLLDAAVVATEKAIESVPDDAAILDTLAHLVHKQGDLDRAIQLQTKAVENAKGRIADQLADFLEELKSEQATITNESL